MATIETILPLIDQAFSRREPQALQDSSLATRLFNGFYEGYPSISIDRYGRTLVIHLFQKDIPSTLPSALSHELITRIPDTRCVLLKDRTAEIPDLRRGTILYGDMPDRIIREWGVSYSVNLQLNQDAGFYLDTALLRQWLIRECNGKTILNTFAYTGSFGAAALAGGAKHVIQTDLNCHFLEQFNNTAALNYFAPENYSSIIGDFFKVTATLRKQNKLFDIILLDPPFFSKTRGGKMDQQQNALSLLNKIRPLVAHHGKIIFINNALFLSGAKFIEQLTESFQDGFIRFGEIISIPESFFGGVKNVSLPADPAPFNHPTKIVVLDVMRKDERAS